MPIPSLLVGGVNLDLTWPMPILRCIYLCVCMLLGGVNLDLTWPMPILRCIYLCVCLCMYDVYACTCVYVCMYVCVCVCMYVSCMYVEIDNNSSDGRIY